MLENHWYIACRSRAINRKPVALQAFGRHLVAFRDGGGRAGVLIDRCAHRNAPLSHGRISDGLLQCPYHGWGYDADGVVQNIPSAPGSGKPLKRLCIDASVCVEQDGYLWFCPSGEPPTEQPPAFPFLGEPGWKTFRMNNVFNGPVETCLENFLDCPHATFVHRFWFRKPTLKTVRAVVRDNDDGAEAEYFDEPRQGSVVWSVLSRKNATMRHVDRFIAPATSRVDYDFSDGRYYVITSVCTPIDDKTTRVHTVISFRFGRIAALVRLVFEPLSRWIISQDVRMVALQQENIER
ncbi:MAG: aromatic ring-hydroxylating dioxygenase subunit alpha, partial [Gammaproteobacteria bacterium]|nr:aromatic ring-hydroxylating dioxygenase subunit alpha [Gammaproteobacteria bacterium]